MPLRAPIPRPSLGWRLFVIVGVGAMKALSFSDPAWEWWQQRVTDRIPRRTIRAVLLGTLVVHLLESVATFRVAKRGGLDDPLAYAKTAFTYGFPAYVIARRAVRESAAGGVAVVGAKTFDDRG